MEAPPRKCKCLRFSTSNAYKQNIWAHVSFTQSCYFRSDWDDNAVDSILFNLTFSANIHLFCSYLQHLAMVCCPFPWLFIRWIFFSTHYLEEISHSVSIFFSKFHIWLKQTLFYELILTEDGKSCVFFFQISPYSCWKLHVYRKIHSIRWTFCYRLFDAWVRSTENWHFQLNSMLK